MAISGVVGTIGSGKTMFTTWWDLVYALTGYDIFANYRVVWRDWYHNELPGAPKAHDITAMEDFKNMPTKKNFFSVDEVWMLADSRRSSSFFSGVVTRSLMQSRKAGAGKTDVMCTAQDFGMIDVRVRNVTTRVYEPKIIARMPHPDGTPDADGKPLLMRADYFDVTNPKRIRNMMIPLLVDTPWGQVSIPDSYDTYEIVDDMEDPRIDIEEALAEKYMGTEHESKQALKVHIYWHERKSGNVDIKMAERVAEYVHMNRPR
jgi:hypothetical protein